MEDIKQKVDFTSGKVFGKIILFVLPIIATNLLQTFYNAADMMIVSFSDEVNAVGAVGVTTSFVNLIVNLFIGFSVGANVMLAKWIGAKRVDRAQNVVHTSVIMAFIFGLFGTAIGVIVSRPVLVWMGA